MTIMGFLSSAISDFFEYKTPKIVQIRNKKIGVVNRLIQLGIVTYVIAFAIVLKKGYQNFSDVESAVTTKVKGVVSTINLSDSEFSNRTPPEMFDIYRRVWDVPDYEVPASESNAFFVTTNLVITPNQTLGTCPEDAQVEGSLCSSDDDCEENRFLYLGNGPQTGKCSIGENDTGTCEIRSWCPLEVDTFPLVGGKALLADSANFTVLIKNTIKFPKFKVIRHNILDTDNKTYLSVCKYGPEQTHTEGPLCPIFVLGDIVRAAGEDYDTIARKGAVIGIIIDWECNLDKDIKRCIPQYSFRRMDDSGEATIAPGMNFRYAQYFEYDRRTLFKAYGIRFTLIVTGQGGRFSVVPLLVNIGSGLGLLAITTIICDVIAFYFVTGRDYYKANKFLYVDREGNETENIAPQSRLERSRSDYSHFN